MPAVTINSGQIGRIEREFADEGELYAFIIAWCVQRDRTISGTYTLPEDTLFWPAGTYTVSAGPDGVGWLNLEAVG